MDASRSRGGHQALLPGAVPVVDQRRTGARLVPRAKLAGTIGHRRGSRTQRAAPRSRPPVGLRPPGCGAGALIAEALAQVAERRLRRHRLGDIVHVTAISASDVAPEIDRFDAAIAAPTTLAPPWRSGPSPCGHSPPRCSRGLTHPRMGPHETPTPRHLEEPSGEGLARPRLPTAALDRAPFPLWASRRTRH